jgi:hypothetical protein
VSMRRCRPICKCKKGVVINNNVFYQGHCCFVFGVYIKCCGERDGLGVLATLPCVVVGPGTIFFY